MSEFALLRQRLMAGRESNTREATGRRASTPSRVMVPRMVYIATVVVLVLFGLLMIFSASSISGLTGESTNHDPAYYLVRQLGFSVIGVVMLVVLARFDYHMWRGGPLKLAWGITMALLALVYTGLAGQETYGAARWIAIGGFTLQPSEFAKVTVILVGAYLAEEYYAKGVLAGREMLKHLAVGIGLPLALVLFQPDKGTTGVLLLTLLVMVYLCGVPGRTIIGIAVVGVAGALLYALKDDYSRARIMTVFNPFGDEYGAGYQLVQGFYALGSGGLSGVGLGLSRQKYNYLPMAHNDFIFAVVGEELGFIGAVLLLLAFCVLLWAGLKIAENAPDLTGRLIAAGCTSLLVIQLLLNVSGVVGLFPLSGKPVPFVSYGGSSVISSLMLVGLVLSVSLRSTLPQTRYDDRRAELRLAPNATLSEVDGSTAGVVRPRSARLVHDRQPMVDDVQPPRTTRSDLRIVEGGAPRSARLVSRGTVNTSTLRRIDLGPSAADRLRSRHRDEE